jgi:hypothetical protein
MVRKVFEVSRRFSMFCVPEHGTSICVPMLLLLPRQIPVQLATDLVSNMQLSAKLTLLYLGVCIEYCLCFFTQLARCCRSDR